MARDSRGRFTRRASPRRRLRPSTGPVEGVEVNGIVTGPVIVLGGASEPAQETKATKK
jgi:hypothetical protein